MTSAIRTVFARFAELGSVRRVWLWLRSEGRRGLFQKDYVGPTLRDNLGLAILRATDWHAAHRAPVR
ncbi:MAG TPA: hypothetical protein VLJ17_01765 [Xanthobacteraceae bacterium]|nr:hypothetical protein [Xanthobacteraceae bacterium]